MARKLAWSKARRRDEQQRDRSELAGRKRRQQHARELISSLSPQIDALLAVCPSTRVACPWRLEGAGPCPLRDRCPCGGRGWVTAGWLAHRFRASVVAAVAQGARHG